MFLLFNTIKTFPFYKNRYDRVNRYKRASLLRAALLLFTGLFVHEWLAVQSAQAQNPNNTNSGIQTKQASIPTSTVTLVTSGETVQIVGKNLKYVVTNYEFDPPYSAHVKSMDSVIYQGVVTPAEVKDLITAIRTSGFFKLDTLYGVGEKKRHYIYIVHIHDGKTEKEVVYRRGTNKNDRPQAFAQTVDLIIEFAKKKTNYKE